MPLHVFGYGSLMWRPDFPHLRRREATLHGLHRRLCVYSWVHRGTPERPGLVVGLDEGGACRGVVFDVADADADAVIAALRAREQVTMVYLERRVPVICADGETLEALTYVVDRSHAQYAGALATEAMVRTVRGAVGRSGPNEEYVTATADHLASMGIHDPNLAAVAAALTQRPPATA